MKKKSIALFFMSLTMTASLLGGCSSSDNAEKQNVPTTEPTVSSGQLEPSPTTEEPVPESTEANPTTETPQSQESQTTNSEEGFSFADVSNLEFCFASGAGAWETNLYIQGDGTFTGRYHDSDMGDSGEGYPNGTQYYSEFSGKFSEPVKVNDYTYSVKIKRLHLENKENTEEIKDGIKYIYSAPYGLDKAKDILFYLPGAPVKDLPEDFMSWMMYAGISKEKNAKLPFYGLYNEAQGEGFGSGERSKISENSENSPIADELKAVENKAAEIEKKLQDETLAQQEMNQLSYQLYELWDKELNDIWKSLKQTLEQEAMDKLTKEEKSWITYKESEVKKAGAENEGGSLQPLLENQKAAKLTKERVYELADYLQ